MSAHADGRMIEINNCDKGAVQRRAGGAIPSLDLGAMLFRQIHQDEVMRMLVGGGGLCRTSARRMRAGERRIDEGDATPRWCMAVLYGFAKAIGSMAAVLGGRVDVVAITGHGPFGQVDPVDRER